MNALDRKLLRDLWRLRGQVMAVAFIVASGVAVLVMSLTSHEALQDTADAYYERYRFAEVFGTAKRAPEPLVRRIAALPGVQSAESRISEFAIVDVEGFAEPVMANVVSIPEHGQPELNRLALRSGRWISATRSDEVIVNEPFLEDHGLALGDELSVIMRGHKRSLTIVGSALSPEFVYAIGPGALMPDDLRYGIFWVGRKTLEAAYDLDGAFNTVALSLLRGTPPEGVIARLDELLERNGGTGAYARADQISNWFLTNELDQLERMSGILPTVFLVVAAFLTNAVLARLIAIERGEIGVLKAFGYSNLAIGWHYAKMAMAMAGLGVLIGWGLGYWLGYYNTSVYADLYRFPFLLFRPSAEPFLVAGVVSLGASLLGALGAVRGAVALPPAEAMRPPAPPSFHKSAGVLAGLTSQLDQPTRMIVRQIGRWPLRSALTVTGVGMSIAVSIMAIQWIDSIDRLVEVYYHQAQRQDAVVALADPEDEAAVRAFTTLPGVLAAEPARVLPVTFRAGQLRHRGSLEGVEPDARLSLVYDAGGRIVQVPPEGLVLSTMLARKLGVAPGDSVLVEVREGRRPVRTLPVAEVFETYIGMAAYIDRAALNRLMLEPRRVDLVSLLIDSAEERALYAELKEIPKVSAVMLRRAAVDTFYETLGETLMIFVSLFIVFACTLSVGVVYNAARIALSERGRELATLRVLGFSRWEIAYFLLGEAALLVLVALPAGCLFGAGLAWIVVAAFESELFRIPYVIEPSTYGIAVLICLVSALVSGLLVRRRLDRLDLIAVLKTRE